MNRRSIFYVLYFGLLAAAAIAFVSSDVLAAACKWRNIAIGCNGDCVEIAFQNPAANCPGSTVDVQKRDCAGGDWVTVATNVVSPVSVNCASPGTSFDYRLVVHCSCGGSLPSLPLGCTTCP